jgi:hypothetical protein
MISPGLEVRDDLFDDVTDLVDLLIELFFPVRQVTVDGFFDRSEHVIANVAFVAYPVAGLIGYNAGFIQAVGVMTAAVDRVGDPREISGQRAGDLDVEARRLVLAGVQLGWAAHDQQGSKVPSTMECACGCRSSATDTYPASAVPSSGVRAVTARLIVD